MRPKIKQILSLALLPFVLAASVASLDALVLCTAECHGTAVEVVHPAGLGFGSYGLTGCGYSGCCGHSEGSHPEIGHDHVSCNDIPLRLNLGVVKDRRPIVALQVESFVIEDVERVSSEPSLYLPDHHSSLRQLKSVVLLV